MQARTSTKQERPIDTDHNHCRSASLHESVRQLIGTLFSQCKIDAHVTRLGKTPKWRTLIVLVAIDDRCKTDPVSGQRPVALATDA